MVRRAWIGFGLLVSLTALTAIGTSSMARRTARDLAELTGSFTPMHEAAAEMEINIIGQGLATVKYLELRGSAQRVRIAHDREDYARFRNQFDVLVDAYAGSDRLAGGVLERLDSAYAEYVVVGDRLTFTRDIQARLLVTLEKDLRDFDEVLQGRMQPLLDSGSPGDLKDAIRLNRDVGEMANAFGLGLLVNDDRHLVRVIESLTRVEDTIGELGLGLGSGADSAAITEGFDALKSAILEDMRLRSTASDDFDRLNVLREILDGVVDDEIQPWISSEARDAEAAALSDVDSMIRTIAAMLALGVGLAVILGIRLSRRFSRPLSLLTSGVLALGSGDLSHRIQLAGKHELADIARQIDAMAEEIQDDREALLSTQRDLETALSRGTAALEAEMVRGRALIEGVPDTILRLNAVGIIVACSSPIPGALAVPATDAVGMLIHQVVASQNSDQLRAAIHMAGVEGRHGFFEHDVRQGSTTRQFETRCIPVDRDGEVLLIVRDITERTMALRLLEESIRARTEFLASVSHELRTPLTSVLGFAELLSNSETSVAEGSEYARRIVHEAQDMAAIVEDLLVAARVELGDVIISNQPVDLTAITHRVADSVSDRSSVAIEIEDASPVTAMGDAPRVRQIVRNLLTNAHRYGGARIRVSFETFGDIVAIRVSDNGPGIPAADRLRIFELFERAHSQASQPQSVGIGLSISQTLARLMDGDLVYSYEDGWSTFELSLPVSAGQLTA